MRRRNPITRPTNERDRSGETKTSGDQSNSSADLKITQAIRQALMKDRELSNSCEEHQSHYRNGQVTLRGPVKSAQEKAKSISLQNQRLAAPRLTTNSKVKGSN